MKEWSFQSPATTSEHAATIESLKQHARKVADKLDAGEPLGNSEAAFAALALRQWADLQSSKKPRAKGRPAKVNASDVALFVEGKKRMGMSLEAAKGQAAEQFNVDVDTIRNALKAKGAEAKLHYDFILGKK